MYTDTHTHTHEAWHCNRIWPVMTAQLDTQPGDAMLHFRPAIGSNYDPAVDKQALQRGLDE